MSYDLRFFFIFYYLTSWFANWSKKRVKFIWVPEIMINDLVHKGHTKLNMLSVFGEQIKSLCSQQSKLNFWNRLHPTQFMMFLDTNSHLTTKPYHFDIMCQFNSESYNRHNLLAKFRGFRVFFIYGGRFLQQERVV